MSINRGIMRGKLYCKRGHALIGYNLSPTYSKKYPNGTRCRKCMNILARDYKRRKRDENNDTTGTTSKLRK